jgi:tetrahydromethanopterin S-methyltransferase subunit B
LLRNDLTAVKETMNRTTPIADMHPVEASLNTLVDKVTNLKRFLSPSTRKRGLLDLGGGVLKVLFDTATVQDINSLHHTIDELHKKQEEVAHSVEQQVTYSTHRCTV